MKVETIGDIKEFCNSGKLFYFVGPHIMTSCQKAKIYNQCVFVGSPIKADNNKIAFIGVIVRDQDPIVRKLIQPDSGTAFFEIKDEVKLEGIKATLFNKPHEYTEITGIFDDLEEAKEYLKVEVKGLKKYIAVEKRELSKYTVTIEQIANMFNIPTDKLIIKGIYNDIY